MKGVIVDSLAELVKNKFGKDKWEQSLEKAGLSKYTIFLPIQDVDDEVVLKLIGAVCEVLGITLEQAADAFGDYWINEYAPNIYPIYYKDVNSAKDFILKMDDVHKNATMSIKNAKPPRFEYEWKDDKTLIMKYKSHRKLIDIAVGLVRGIGKHFNEELEVSKLDDENIKIVFK